MISALAMKTPRCSLPVIIQLRIKVSIEPRVRQLTAFMKDRRCMACEPSSINFLAAIVKMFVMGDFLEKSVLDIRNIFSELLFGYPDRDSKTKRY